MTTEQRLDYVREALAGYKELSRPACDEIGWVALKLSCTQEEARRLIHRVTLDDEDREIFGESVEEANRRDAIESN